MTSQEVLARLRSHECFELPAGSSRRAAVLVPLRELAGGTLEVVLTRRTESLAHHSGQVAFPGGMIDASDADARAAALREAQEEIALEPTRVDVVARLDDFITGTGFHVAPFVGLVEPGATLVPSAAEVARVFAVPMTELLRPEQWSQRVHERHGHRYLLWHYHYDGEEIWGATAAILRSMMRLLGINSATE